MRGVTPAVDSVLAARTVQRLDLVSLSPQVEITGPTAVVRVEKIVNDVRQPSRAALDQQLELDLSRRSNVRSGLKLPASAGVTLSAVARAISAILDPQAGPLSKIRSSEPLWLHARSPVAPLLAIRLAQMVAHSGLFYESHLQQFAAGSRSLELMIREPQAGLVFSVLPAASIDMALAPHAPTRLGVLDTGAASGAGQAAESAAVHAKKGEQSVHGTIAQTPAVYGRDGKPGNSQPAFHEIAGQVADVETPVKDSKGGFDGSNAVAAAIHPDAMGLVRQQLELLSVPMFRWSGEAWPGTPIEWDIGEEQADDAATTSAEAVQPAWTTNLTMTLPTLQSVAARLTLCGNNLQVRLVCDEDATLAVMHQGRHALSRQLGSLGLQVTTLQVARAGAEDVSALRNEA